MTCREFVQDVLLNVPLDNKIIFKVDDKKPYDYTALLFTATPFETYGNESIINLTTWRSFGYD